jgi:hypothetical protein
VLTSTPNDAPAELHSFQLSVDTRLPHAVISNPPEVGPLMGATALNSKHSHSEAKSNTRQKKKMPMKSSNSALHCALEEAVLLEHVLN